MKTGDKEARLKQIAAEVQHLEASPLYDYRRENDYSPVIGEGDLDAALMFVGEAPGKQEAETGRPFVGRAGQLLDELLRSIGLAREDVYITNIVKDRPPNNRSPRVKEIEIYAPFLVRQMEIIQPDVIAPLGRFATNFILEHFERPEAGEKMGELHSEVIKVEAGYGTVDIVPLYHPAAVFYNRSLDRTLRDDFQVLKRFTGMNHGLHD